MCRRRDALYGCTYVSMVLCVCVKGVCVVSWPPTWCVGVSVLLFFVVVHTRGDVNNAVVSQMFASVCLRRSLRPSASARIFLCTRVSLRLHVRVPKFFDMCRCMGAEGHRREQHQTCDGPRTKLTTYQPTMTHVNLCCRTDRIPFLTCGHPSFKTASHSKTQAIPRTQLGLFALYHVIGWIAETTENEHPTFSELTAEQRQKYSQTWAVTMKSLGSHLSSNLSRSQEKQQQHRNARQSANDTCKKRKYARAHLWSLKPHGYRSRNVSQNETC